MLWHIVRSPKVRRLTQVDFFDIADSYRGRRRHGGCRTCNALGWVRNGRGCIARRSAARDFTNIRTAVVASPAGFEPATCGLEIGRHALILKAKSAYCCTVAAHPHLHSVALS